MANFDMGLSMLPTCALVSLLLGTCEPEGPRRLFVLTDEVTYYQLRRDHEHPLHLVAENKYSVVFSNQIEPSSVVN